MARILFVILINYDFIPTTYLTILAVIMNQHAFLDCPNSAVGLFNRFYIDLFSNPGTIVNIVDMELITRMEESKPAQPDLATLLMEAHIGQNEDSPEVNATITIQDIPILAQFINEHCHSLIGGAQCLLWMISRNKIKDKK